MTPMRSPDTPSRSVPDTGATADGDDVESIGS
jgi:hypothetical protein